MGWRGELEPANAAGWNWCAPGRGDRVLEVAGLWQVGAMVTIGAQRAACRRWRLCMAPTHYSRSGFAARGMRDARGQRPCADLLGGGAGGGWRHGGQGLPTDASNLVGWWRLDDGWSTGCGGGCWWAPPFMRVHVQLMEQGRRPVCWCLGRVGQTRSNTKVQS